MLVTTVVFLLLGYNAVIVTSDCPKSQEWRNLKVSPGGPLVCARLYADSKCSGFPLPFGINSSSSDLGTESSASIDFEQNNVTALVRPGCNMYLWEGVNFTGEHGKSINYIWNINHRHYRSALCNCSVDDLELLQCELREEWELINFCDFRKSDVGGLCSVTLKRSHIGNGSNDSRNLTITNNLAHLFVDKVVESFGEERMTSFLDVNSSDKVAHSVFVEARSGIKIKQRAYVCGQYHLSTPEVLKEYERKDEAGHYIVPKRDTWIYNHVTRTYFWFSSAREKYSVAEEKCEEMGAGVSKLTIIELQHWMKPFFPIYYGIWISGTKHRTWNNEDKCPFVYFHDLIFDWQISNCNNVNHYVCERENYI